MNVFTIWSICHKNGNPLVGLGPIDVASHQAFERLQFDSDILFHYVWERNCIDNEEIVSNLVRHIGCKCLVQHDDTIPEDTRQ